MRRLFASLLVVLVAAAALAPSACTRKSAAADPNAAPNAASPDRGLGAAIDEAIGLLETQKVEAFLRRFVPPDEVVTFLTNSSYEARARQFAGRPSHKLLRKLLAIKAKQPVWNSDRSEASFTLDEELDGEFKLVRVAGTWYIRN